MSRHHIHILLLCIASSTLSSPTPPSPRYHTATPIRSSIRSPKIEDTLHPEDPNLPHKRLISSINKFSNRLYNVMNEYKSETEYSSESLPEDLIYSPITIFTSLSTLQSGSTKETKQELSTILSISKINDSVIQEGVNSILQTYKSESNQVNVINRVFLDHSFTPTSSYVNNIRDKFHGEVVQTHFSNATAASMFVNNNVYVASHGILQDVITVDQDPVSSTESPTNSTLLPQHLATQSIDGGLMLISGLTFEGDWDRPFTPLLTRKATFTREDGSNVEVDMMHRDGVYLYAEIPELNASALNIPYKDGRYSLTVLLPEEGVSVAQLEDSLESFPCVAVMSRLGRAYMEVGMPRFTVEGTVDLIDPLEKIGVRRVFSEDHAQLNKLVKNLDDGELYLTNAVHKVVLDVREGGSRVKSQNFIEAVPVQPRILTEFKVNRPFVFFITDQLLNAVLMVGRKVF